MEQNKTITCGRCGRKLPLGQAHNSRTCGTHAQQKPRLPQDKIRKNHPTMEFDTNPHQVTLSDITITDGLVPVAKKIPERGTEQVTLDASWETLKAEGYQRHPIRVKQAWSVTEPDGDPLRDLARSFTIEEWTKPTGEKVIIHYETKNIPLFEFLNKVGLKSFTKHFLKLKRYRRRARSTIYYLNADGELHRDGDKPAEINIRPAHGKKGEAGHEWAMRWYKDGSLHRDNKPAAVLSDGSEAWHRNGTFHRDGGPAIVESTGATQWWVDGKRHRVDGPALSGPPLNKQDRNGSHKSWESWYVNGVQTGNAEACKKATRSNLADEDFYELCTHEDYVVKHIAANNPKCPPEWSALVALREG